MPDIHIGVVELTTLIGSIVLSYGSLHFKTNRTVDDVKKLRDDYESHKDGIMAELSSMNKSLARIEGFMLMDKKEHR